MAKDTDNTLFVSTWNDLITGYDYKLEIIPVATSDFTLAKTVNLPENFIQSLTFEYGDDEYGIDLTLPVMNVTIDCLSYYNTGTDDDIFDVLFYPFLDLTYDYYGVYKTITSGNIFKLYCKFNVDDTVNEPDAPDYRLMFTGIQKKGIESGYKHKEYILELDIHDAGKVITESVDMQYLMHYSADYDASIGIGATYRKQFFDYVCEPVVGKLPFYQAYKPAGTDFSDMQKKNFWFITWNKHIEVLEYFAKTVAQIVLRDSTISAFNIELPLPKLYKQNYLNDGSVNTATLLSADDVYLTIFVIAGTTVYGGAYYNDISKDYKTLWDYLSDYYKQNLRRAFFNPDLSIGFYTFPLYNVFNDLLTVSSKTDNNNIIFIDDAPTLFCDVLQRVSVASVKAKNKDIKEYEIVKNSSRSDKTKSIAVIHNNTPNAPEKFLNAIQNDDDRSIIYHGATTQFGINTTKTKGCHIYYQTSGADFKGLYYLDNPVSVEFAPATHFTEPQFIRVNEQAKIYLGDTLTSDNAYTQIAMNFVKYMTNTYNDVSESIYVQNNSGLPRAIAESMMYVFTDNLQSKFIFNTSLRTGTEFLLGGSRGCLWFNPYATVIGFNPNELSPDTKPTVFNDYPAYYAIVKGKLHIKDNTDTGTVTMSVLGAVKKPFIP